MSTLSEAITAYRICAKAEGKSPRTIEWITSSIGYFTRFLGRDADIATITADNLRRFIVGMLDSYRYADHPFARPQNNKISPQSVKTYARAIRAFIGYLHREELIEHNPMKKVKMTRVPKKVVPTFSEREVKKLLAQPDKNNDRGFRDYTLLLTYIDTSARLSEIALLKTDDIDLENGYLRVMGKGNWERYVPFGQKVAKALLKYR